MKIMTATEAAKLLRVNVETMREWLREGRMPGSNTPAGWRITEANITAFLKNHRKTRRPRQKSSVSVSR